MNKRSLTRTVTTILGTTTLLLIFASPVSAGWYVVEPGDTLWHIGEQYGVDAADIAEVNGIGDPELIHVGDQLWIPEDGEAAPGTDGEIVVYIVEAGDTIASIAASYGIDTTELANFNGIESPYLIYPGEEIIIPNVEPPIQPEPVEPVAPGTINPEIPYVDVETVRSAVIELSEAYGWDPYLIVSLAWHESTLDQRALSPSGAVGVMQLMPATADWAGPALAGRETDYVNNAWDNIEVGIAFLSYLRVETGSDYLALASYFQGLASVERDGIFPATREYALGIIESRDLFASGALP